MGAFIKTTLACVCSPCRMSPFGCCVMPPDLWDFPCTARGTALLKPFVILFLRNIGTGIYSRLCTGVTVSDLLCAGTGAKLNLLYCLITSCKNSFTLFLSSLNVEFLHKQVPTIQLLQMQICACAPEWNLHSVLSTILQGGEDKEGRGTSARR